MASMGVQENPVVLKAFNKRRITQFTKRYLYQCVLNLLLTLVLYVDLSCQFTSNFFEINSKFYWYLEAAFVSLAALNFVVNSLRYLGNVSSGSVEMSSDQKKLLGVQENEPGFKTAPGPKKVAPSPIVGSIISPSTFCGSQNGSFNTSAYQPVNSIGFSHPHSPSVMKLSPAGSISPSFRDHFQPSSSQFNTPTSFLMNPSPNTSLGVSNLSAVSHAHSFTSQDGATTPNNLSNSRLTSPPAYRDASATDGNSSNSGLRSRLHNTSIRRSPMYSENCIKDMKEYSQFLKEHDESRCDPTSRDSPGSTNQSFWNFNRSITDFSPMLRRYAYQIACRSPASSNKTREEHEDGAENYAAEEIWNRAGVKVQSVDASIEKLRKWLGQTIMMRLVTEIHFINKNLVKLGCDDMEIGEVSISTLKQLAFTKAQHLFTLNAVIPFLEVSDNQMYVVQRIKELGSDGCIADFRWQKGSDLKGQPWAEHLPTDSTLLMHLFCSYMDSRLPPHPNYPDGKTFTSQHFLKVPEKPNLENMNNLLLYQTTLNPPHFKVVIGNDIWDVAKGRNNFFHALLLFLHHINTMEKGMLGKVNLGLSGINIMCVVQE